jgi:hypothetical protein
VTDGNKLGEVGRSDRNVPPSPALWAGSFTSVVEAEGGLRRELSRTLKPPWPNVSSCDERVMVDERIPSTVPIHFNLQPSARENICEKRLPA